MKLRKKNLELLKKNHIYSESMEHDSCGVGVVASTEGLKSRKVVEQGIEALKAVWHRGAIDADGKTGDGAGIHVEIPSNFFIDDKYLKKNNIDFLIHGHDNKNIVKKSKLLIFSRTKNISSTILRKFLYCFFCNAIL